MALFIACLFIPQSSAIFFDSPSILLPSIDFNHLIAGDVSMALSAADSLASIGAIQIINIPNFEAARLSALANLGTCLQADENVRTMTMNDGSKRSTIASGIVNGLAQQLTSPCGKESAKLRSLVSVASRQLFQALDELIAINKPKVKPTEEDEKYLIMEPYFGFEELVRSGEHLEHFHAYYGKDTPVPSPQGKIF